MNFTRARRSEVVIARVRLRLGNRLWLYVRWNFALAAKQISRGFLLGSVEQAQQEASDRHKPSPDQKCFGSFVFFTYLTPKCISPRCISPLVHSCRFQYKVSPMLPKYMPLHLVSQGRRNTRLTVTSHHALGKVNAVHGGYVVYCMYVVARTSREVSEMFFYRRLKIPWGLRNVLLQKNVKILVWKHINWIHAVGDSSFWRSTIVLASRQDGDGVSLWR